jgi:hypothetical protein
MIGDGIAAVKSIVEGLGQNILYHSVQRVDNSYRFFVKTTLWLKVGDTINELGTNAYQITGLLCNTWIEVPVPNELLLPEPTGFLTCTPLTFKNGTLRRVQKELTQKSNASLWLPLVYMVEVMSSEQDLSPTSNYSDVIDCRLFILEQVNFNDLQTSPEYYAAAITKCERIAKEILIAFSRSPLIGKLTSRRAWNHINAGTYDSKGGVTNLFPTYTSGVEMRLPLPLVKRCIC